MRVLVLGHKGMLGHMVYKYLSTKEDCELYTTDLRWPTEEFKDFIIDFWYGREGTYIINCIGAIHQRTNEFDVNTDLPIWLDDNIDYNLSGCKVIHPGTDCEMDDDDYGNSKRKAAEYLKETGCMTKIIKTSIIGPELTSKVSLLDWFLDCGNEVSGYSEAYWNGNTTFQWAKICYDMMKNYDKYGVENIIASLCISKYELLNKIKIVYNKDISVVKNSNVKMDKCLVGDISTPSIEKQLEEMKEFYYDN
jgi:dTDP-4-dehydrorhamnose reductase